MTLQEMQNQITDLGNQIRTAANTLAAQAMDSSVSEDEVNRQRAALEQMNARMRAMQASYQTMQDAQGAGVQPLAQDTQQAQQPVQLTPAVVAMRRSNEYARAFAYAIRNGINVKNGRGNEHVKVLFDALTETGGNPTGSDGGFLVPEDVDNQIRELRRDLNPLADVFGQETVTAPTGWRVVDTAPGTGMSKVNEMATIPIDDQPVFRKVTYSVDKYGLIVPCSNELMNDNVANLFAYLSRWFARKQVLTENALLLAALKTLTASPLAVGTANEIDGLKTALNKGLDPAISVGAVIICNQDGFDVLDQLKDDTGRGLLQPDPTNPTQYRIKGRNVKMVSNAVMPSGTGEGATADIYIGDGHEFATLFVREGFEVASTDIGGNAWKTDSTEVRGICRIGVSKFDEAAMLRRSVTL